MVSVGERPVPAPAADPHARPPAEADTRLPRPAGGADRLHLIGLGVVMLLAVIARFWGLLYGLPHSYYPDESSVVGDALTMATTGDPRPSQFLWPTFWIYVVAISIRGGLLVSWLPGGLGPLGTPALDNMTYVYGLSRTVTALAGVLSVLGVYAIGARWLALLGLPHPRLNALFGAGFLALSPVHIQHSHVTSPDVPTVAFIVLAAYCVVRLFETGATRWYLLGGIAIGLASAAKYPSAMFAVALVAAHLARAGLSLRRPWTLPLALFDLRLWAAGLVTVVTFFATSPYILIDWQRFQTDFLPQARRAFERGSVGGIGLSGPDAWYMFGVRVIQWGLDTPVALLVVVGLVAAAVVGVRSVRRQPTVAWALLTILVFPLLLYVFSWSWQQRFARYLLAIIPFGCLLAALGLAALTALVSRRCPALPIGLLTAAVGVAAMLWQADGVVRYDLLLTRPDTRTLAARWLDEHLPPGEQILVEWYGPPYGNVRQLGFDLSDRPLDRYLGRTPRFVVTSSFTYDRWLRDPVQFGRRVAFYTALHQQTPLLVEIRPWPEFAYDPIQEGWDGWHGLPLDASARPGPVLRVHQLTP